MKTEVSNILSVFDQATPEERRTGCDWYFEAHKTAVQLAKEFQVSVPTAAGVLATLSPNQRWESNVRAARKLLQGFRDGKTPNEITVNAYNKNKEKAFALCRGGSRGEFLKGPKVNCFYKNIISPWTSSSITVDGHAFSIWAGKRYTVRSKENKFTPKKYAAIAADYKEAARALGLRPWQVQAVTWVVWHRLNSISGEMRLAA